MTPMDVVDAATAPTAPFDPGTPAHATLARLVGAWEGPTKTWMDPDAAPAVSTTRAQATLLLGGRFLELDTASEIMDTPHAGRFVVGYHRGGSEGSARGGAEGPLIDGKELVGIWIDSFHTGTDLMACKGVRRADGVLELTGHVRRGRRALGLAHDAHRRARGRARLDRDPAALEGARRRHPGRGRVPDARVRRGARECGLARLAGVAGGERHEIT